MVSPQDHPNGRISKDLVESRDKQMSVNTEEKKEARAAFRDDLKAKPRDECADWWKHSGGHIDYCSLCTIQCCIRGFAHATADMPLQHSHQRTHFLTSFSSSCIAGEGWMTLIKPIPLELDAAVEGEVAGGKEVAAEGTAAGLTEEGAKVALGA